MNDLFTSMQKAGLAGVHMATGTEAGKEVGDRRQDGKIFYIFYPIFDRINK